MTPEQEILKQEELDLSKVVGRFFNAWPLVLLSVGVFVVLGVLFLLCFPPSYSAKASFLVEKPMGVKDPSSMMVEMPDILKIDDYYYTNRKHELLAYPTILNVVEELGLGVQYVQKGILDKDIYSDSPIALTVDSNAAPVLGTPYEVPFYVTVISGGEFDIEAEGEYPDDGPDICFEGRYSFGQWMELDGFRFKMDRRFESSMFDSRAEEFEENVYGFIMKRPEDVALDLQEQVLIEKVEAEGTLLSMTYDGSTKEKSLEVLSTIARLNLDKDIEEKLGVVDKAIDFLNDELELNIAEAARLNAEIEEIKRNNGLTGYGEYDLLTSRDLQGLEQENVALLLKGKYYDYLLEELGAEQVSSDIISPAAFGLKDPLLNNLTSELVGMIQERDAMEASGTQANPSYAQLQSRIQADSRTILGTVRGFKESNNIALSSLSDRMRSMEGDLRRIPGVQNVLSTKDRILRIHEGLISTLRQRISTAALNRIATRSDIIVVEEPHLTDLSPSFPKPEIILPLALLIGIVIPILLALMKSLFGARIYGSDEVLNRFNKPQRLGVVSNSAIHNADVLSKYTSSRLYQEASRLVFAIEQTHPGSSIIAITSLRNDEGKRFLCESLSVVAAMQGHRILLVDAHPSKDFDPSLGWAPGNHTSQWLEGYGSIADMIQQSSVPGLDLIVSGSFDERLLESGTWVAALDAVKSTYDRVILYTPPFGSSSSVYRLMQNTDLNIIVTRRGITRHADVELIKEDIDKGLIRNALITVNDVFERELRLNPLGMFKSQNGEPSMGFFGYIQRIWARI